MNYNANNRRVFIYIGILFGIIALILLLFYRPYIYQNNINDFYFADTLGSLFCVPTTVFLSYGIHKKFNFLKLLIVNVLFWIIYEVPTSITQGVIDRNDYVAIIIGGLFSLLFFYVLNYFNNRNSKHFYGKKI